MCKNTATYTNNKKNRPFKFWAFLINFFLQFSTVILLESQLKWQIFFQKKLFIHLSRKVPDIKQKPKKLSETDDCKLAFLNIKIQLTYKTKELHTGTTNLQLRLVKGVAAQLNF